IVCSGVGDVKQRRGGIERRVKGDSAGIGRRRAWRGSNNGSKRAGAGVDVESSQIIGAAAVSGHQQFESWHGLYGQHCGGSGIESTNRQPRKRAIGSDGKSIDASAARYHIKELAALVNGDSARHGISRRS